MVMSARDNVVSLYRRRGYDAVPVGFALCPSLEEEYRRRGGTGYYGDGFGFAVHGTWEQPARSGVFEQQRWFPGESFKPGTVFDAWGVGHEPGSEAAHHMTRMLHPLGGATGQADLEAYPFPDWDAEPSAGLRRSVAEHHARGVAVSGSMECTIWETAWYLRGMDRLAADFAEDPDFATTLLDRITERSERRARAYAAAGCDIICMGDDIGTQSRLMMSPNTYRRWLKPRLRRVIDAAKAVNPDIVIQYHSCGHVTGLVRDLIEAGVEVLNPVQPESMDFAQLHREFAADLSFNGTLGTQSVMPFGTPEQVTAEVHRVLAIAGPRGGLFPCPTHLLEPEVPWANIEAYVAACRSWQG
jgi:uroporphyrinogen decarboxylase